MDFLPKSIKTLIDELSKLPGIGPKSAQRLAFHLLKSDGGKVERLSDAVRDVKVGVQTCSVCFSLSTEVPCNLCSDEGRDTRLLCVVESTLDLVALEKTGEFKGRYHVLQGRLSPLDGVGPDQIRAMELLERLSGVDSAVEEVILALNPDLEGDTTSLFLQEKILGIRPVMISRIARGIPSGGYLEYTDESTLIRALQGRQTLR